jgi:hypothetical protein
MSEFTKGPWKYNEKLFRVIGSGQGIVDMHFGSSAYVSEMSANAHLISAAPDMYEALAGAIRIVDLWYAEFVDDEHAGETEALGIMRNSFESALAKASPK